MAIDIDSYVNQLRNDPDTRGGGGIDPRQLGTGGLDPSTVPNIESTYYNAVLYFLIICGLVAVLSLVYGGILYITSAGETEKAERGKKTITGAIIGIIIIMLSYGAYNYILKAVS